jgi:hypothetical protein
LSVALAAGIAAPAQASVLLGEPQPFGTGSPTTGCTSCQFMILTPPTASPSVVTRAPFSGVITRWRIRASLTWTLTTMRPVLGNNQAQVLRKGSAITLPGTVSDGQADTRTPIAEFDYIGAQTSTGASASIDGKSPAAGASSGFLGPALAAGSSATVTSVANRYDINADLEPDADTDGFGDETQDQCPTDRTTQGPCPVVAPVPVRVSVPTLLHAKAKLAKNAKSISVTFRCPADRTSACAGVVRAQTKTAVLGSGGFSGRPGSSLRARIRLGRAARALFRNGRRRSVRLIVEPSDGPASTRRVTLRKPKAKKKHRR